MTSFSRSYRPIPGVSHAKFGSIFARAGNFPPGFPRGVCDTGGMPVGGRMESCPVLREPPGGFPLPGAGVRPATPEERPLRDALMDRRHHPGFRRLAGRGLRHPAAFRGRWPGLAAWRNGASGAPRATGGPAGGPGGPGRSPTTPGSRARVIRCRDARPGHAGPRPDRRLP